MSKRLLSSLIIHVAGWMLFLLLPLLFLNSGNKTASAWLLLSSQYYWLFCLTYLTLFYLNVWYLIPAFFLKSRYFLYIVFTLLLAGGVYFLQPFDKLLGHNPNFRKQLEAAAPGPLRTPGPAPRPDSLTLPFGPLPHQDMRMHEPAPGKQGNPLWRHSETTDSISIVLFLIITALALAVRTVEQWHITEQRMIRAESDKVNAELSFLKAQINPHFLFNALNNIYTLSVINSSLTSESIMKLSNIMRYVTDEAGHDFVPLADELNCIEDCIGLQKLRLGTGNRVVFSTEGDCAGRQVPPLILMSFVENAFKYGISKNEPSPVTIRIKAGESGILFYCENRIFKRKIADRSGIGINNTRQRLEYLYQGNYRLGIRENDGLFTVTLLLKEKQE